jgi:hypothetical protein
LSLRVLNNGPKNSPKVCPVWTERPFEDLPKESVLGIECVDIKGIRTRDSKAAGPKCARSSSHEACIEVGSLFNLIKDLVEVVGESIRKGASGDQTTAQSRRALPSRTLLF